MRARAWIPCVAACCVVGLLVMRPTIGLAEPPSASDLSTAIQSGDFSGYYESLGVWLSQKVPADVSEDDLNAILGEDEVAKALSQRQLIVKCGLGNLSSFANVDQDSKTFLSWLLNNTTAMDLFLEAATPTGLVRREEDKWTIRPESLGIWKSICNADSESMAGMYQKLAIATAIQPPGSINIGAGGSGTPADPVVRYMHFKNAYQNNELAPSFGNLNVWEYSHVVSSGASDADLAWGREMVRTFRPDLLENEEVIKATSMVWRRSAPAKFYPQGYVNFKNVLAGGGKCGPRAAFATFICQAHGIPAIGVAQPKHACAAWRAYDGKWRVGYGGGWAVSRLDGLSGPDFVAGSEARSRVEQFSRIEHLRWLTSALASSEQKRAVMRISKKLAREEPEIEADLNATFKAEEAEAEPGTVTESRFGKDKNQSVAVNQKEAVVEPEVGPVKAVDGVLHVDAAAFAEMGGVISWGGQVSGVQVMDRYAGGKQIYFQQQMKEQWADYMIDVPDSGTYELVMKAACVNDNQTLEVCSGADVIAEVPVDLAFGLWVETKPVALKLEKGVQTLRVQTPTTEHRRGIALSWFELKKK